MRDRRSFLTGLAAAPIAALSLPKAEAAELGADHPDAALLAMRPRIAAVLADLDAALDRLARAETLKYAGQPSPDLDGAHAQELAANDAWGDLRDDIGQMSACTPDGLRVKATCGPQMWDDNYMMESIVIDILEMTGGAA